MSLALLRNLAVAGELRINLHNIMLERNGCRPSYHAFRNSPTNQAALPLVADRPCCTSSTTQSTLGLTRLVYADWPSWRLGPRMRLLVCYPVCYRDLHICFADCRVWLQMMPPRREPCAAPGPSLPTLVPSMQIPTTVACAEFPYGTREPCLQCKGVRVPFASFRHNAMASLGYMG